VRRYARRDLIGMVKKCRREKIWLQPGFSGTVDRCHDDLAAGRSGPGASAAGRSSPESGGRAQVPR